VSTACVQALNKRIDMIHLAQSVNMKYVQALGEKIGLLHKYTKTSKDWLMSLDDKFDTMEIRIDKVESNYIFFILEFSFTDTFNSILMMFVV